MSSVKIICQLADKLTGLIRQAEIALQNGDREKASNLIKQALEAIEDNDRELKKTLEG
jgi:hypothetical protein